jgi:hypothetical protein
MQTAATRKNIRVKNSCKAETNHPLRLNNALPGKSDTCGTANGNLTLILQFVKEKYPPCDKKQKNANSP